ncbi:hypothetical protein KM043_004128 [Ampulex compressa]|nr:hypothetical protein KM043_004128 [Ampulex compressa]
MINSSQILGGDTPTDRTPRQPGLYADPLLEPAGKREIGFGSRTAVKINRFSRPVDALPRIRSRRRKSVCPFRRLLPRRSLKGTSTWAWNHPGDMMYEMSEQILEAIGEVGERASPPEKYYYLS